LFFWIELASPQKIIGLSRAQTLAYSRFASLNESELSKLLADKDSESTKKATKG
jgi:hypothetical protein